MRKALSLVLAVVMVLSLTTVALAAGKAVYETPGRLPAASELSNTNFFLSFGYPLSTTAQLSDYQSHRRTYNTIDISAGNLWVMGDSDAANRTFFLFENNPDGAFRIDDRAEGNLGAPHNDLDEGTNAIFLLGQTTTARFRNANDAVGAPGTVSAFFIDRRMVGRWDLDVTMNANSTTFDGVSIGYVDVTQLNVMGGSPAILTNSSTPRLSDTALENAVAVVQFQLQEFLHQTRGRVSRDTVSMTFRGRPVTANNSNVRINTRYAHRIDDDMDDKGADPVGNIFRDAEDIISANTPEFRAFGTRGSTSFMNRVEILTENDGVIETRLIANRDYYVAMLHQENDDIVAVLDAYDLVDFRQLFWEGLPANSTVGFDFWNENFYVYTIKEGFGSDEVPALEYLGRSRGGLRLATTYFFAERELDLVTISDLEPEPEFEDDDLFNPGTGPNAGDVNPNWNPGTGR
jgi:hypothetical protein